MMHEIVSHVAHAPHAVVPLRLLILDDNRFDRERVRRYCARSLLPVICREADSIDAMQRLISRESFDVFVLDYRLPDGNGLAALHLLRTCPEARDAGIVMVTAIPEAAVVQAARRGGCDLFLCKDELSAVCWRDILLELTINRAQKSSGAGEERWKTKRLLC